MVNKNRYMQYLPYLLQFFNKKTYVQYENDVVTCAHVANRCFFPRFIYKYNKFRSFSKYGTTQLNMGLSILSFSFFSPFFNRPPSPVFEGSPRYHLFSEIDPRHGEQDIFATERPCRRFIFKTETRNV